MAPFILFHSIWIEEKNPELNWIELKKLAPHTHIWFESFFFFSFFSFSFFFFLQLDSSVFFIFQCMQRIHRHHHHHHHDQPSHCIIIFKWSGFPKWGQHSFYMKKKKKKKEKEKNYRFFFTINIQCVFDNNNNKKFTVILPIFLEFHT